MLLVAHLEQVLKESSSRPAGGVVFRINCGGLTLCPARLKHQFLLMPGPKV